MSRKAEINLYVELDDKKIPKKLSWNATDADVGTPQNCKAFLLNLWDTDSKQALSMHLWENTMSIEEMNDFVFQSMVQIADTFEKATNQKILAEKIRSTALEIWELAKESGTNEVKK